MGFFDLHLGQILLELEELRARVDAGADASTEVDWLDFADDLTWLRVGAEIFNFKKGNQAQVIRVLLFQWARAGMVDGCGLGEADIGEAIGSESARFRVADTFRTHRALGTILRPSQKGAYALYLWDLLEKPE